MRLASRKKLKLVLVRGLDACAQNPPFLTMLSWVLCILVAISFVAGEYANSQDRNWELGEEGMERAVGLRDTTFQAGYQAVRIVQPADGEGLPYIPGVPVWVRLEKGEGYCYEIHLDGALETISCDVDTFLMTQPLPGQHTVRVVLANSADNFNFGSSSAGSSASSVFYVSVGLNLDVLNLYIQQPHLTKEYHKWWYDSGVQFQTRWRGVVTHKSPVDEWNYQEILHELKPAIVLELGTRFGGSTLFFCDVMRTVHASDTSYRILTVDTDRARIDSQVFEEDAIEVLTAPSASGSMRERVKALRNEFPGPMFVIHDPDHDQANVTLELQMVAPLLKNGDFVIVEDANLGRHPEVHEHEDSYGTPSLNYRDGPHDAIVIFMAMNRRFFERDLARETKWGFTQARNGFLIVRGSSDGEIVNPLPHNPYLNL